MREEVSIDFPNRQTTSTGKGLTTQLEIVTDVLKILQGFSTSHFYWNHKTLSFNPNGLFYLSHLSFTPLLNLLSPFLHAASCLQRIQLHILRLNSVSSSKSLPTLSAFASHSSLWLKKLRDVAMKEEMKMQEAGNSRTATLLGLTSSISSLCSGAEYLYQLVDGAIPDLSLSPAKTAVHILDYLYYKLDQLCLVHDGENDTYKMALHIFVGCLFPYVKGLDSWLFEGMLDDPCEEMFFYANKAISVEDSEFWEKSYQLQQLQSQKPETELTHDGPMPSISSMTGKEHKNSLLQACPLFIRDIAISIVSAGKSLQLIRHVPMSLSTIRERSSSPSKIDAFGGFDDDKHACNQGQSMAGLTLYEIFCISVVGLIGHSDHVSRYFLQEDLKDLGPMPQFVADMIGEALKSGHTEQLSSLPPSEQNWSKFVVDAMIQNKATKLDSMLKNAMDLSDRKKNYMNGTDKDEILHSSFCPESPVLTVCQNMLAKSIHSLEALNISRNFYLPHLGDEALREAIFGGDRSYKFGTDYAFGMWFDVSEHLRSRDDIKHLEGMFPFPTLLPSFQDDMLVSELLPFQNNSTIQSRILGWIESAEARTSPHPLVVMQECLTVYIKKQVDYIGRLVLSKLMNDWRLMDELALLRATYLLGSGDLLHHFFIIIFSKLDKGEALDDEFELNTVLQESIRNSADGMLLNTPDSLVVTITRNQGSDGDALPSTPTRHKSRVNSVGLEGLESLKFTYKVPWPLELIANAEAIKKYNQVMGFLMKVKHAKFVLDKARRWMWKGRGSLTNSRKHHWLVEQKLLHFVDAFHQYVMDRVYHSSWRELCDCMAAAGSLDEVIETHEAYLLSIQRLCFVVPDKLWALIASRINTILGLASDFYSTQQSLSSSGAGPAMKAKCEMEVDRIEKQFDDCISFLLRVLSLKLNVGHFPHLADLVTRINYNYFYMSENGSLRTSTGSEMVSSKLGKAYRAGAS